MPFKFSHVCQLLSDLEAINARNPPLIPKDRDEELRRKTQYWFRCHRRAFDLGEVDGVALLSTLLPEKRTDRVYGLQAARLCKVIARCLHLNKSNIRILQSWNEPRTGGLGSCVERVLKEFDCERKPGAYVTVEEADFVLQHLASQCRFSGPEIRSFDTSSSADEQLAQLFKRLNSVEAKWFVRLILKSIAAARIDYAQVISEYHFLLPSLLRFQDSFTSAVSILQGPLKHFPSNPDPAIQRVARIEAGKVLAPLVGTKVGRQTYLKARSLQHCVNMCGSQTWSAERKYDGEYCEVHIDLSKGDKCIQIFSKSGKDSTVDRKGIHKAIRESLRLGENGCAFQKRCIVTGELVVWSDREQKILDFYHLRKHVARSGTFLGRDMDSQIKPGERLMIIFYDILLLDDEMLLREPYSTRRTRMKEVLRYRKGYAIPAERAIIDFRKPQDARWQLCSHFAAALHNRCEGLVLKPVDASYFRFSGDGRGDERGYVIKLKKDYLSELDEMRDVADFAVVGASFDPKIAHKSTIRNVQFTTFHLGCCVNKEAAERFGELPRFEIVAAISLDQCISQPELQALHNYTTFNSSPLQRRGGRLLDPQTFDLNLRQDPESKIQHVMTEPCIVEVLGSGFEKSSNKNYQMLRHPRILKVHADRTWRDACTFEELRLLAEEAKATPAEGESQEMSQLVKKLQGKFQRKAERDCTATPRTATTVSPQSAASHRREQQSSAATPTRSPKRSVARAKASPVLVRVDTSDRLPEESEFASSEPAGASWDDMRGQESLPTPPISSGIVPPSGSRSSTIKRKSPQQEHLDELSKRPRHAVQKTTSVSGDNPLQPREQNIPAPRPAEGPHTTKTPLSKPTTSCTRRLTTTASPARRPASSSRVLACTSTLCPFPYTTIFLSPCIRTFAWVRDTLLPYHGATLTPALSHWVRERLSRPTDSIVPDSLCDPEKQKVVLVETNRLEATFACVGAMKKAVIREVVLWFDWRVLEDWMEAERHDEEAESEVVGETKRKEVLEKRYFGFTCWCEERREVVFMHRDLARMPVGWLGA